MNILFLSHRIPYPPNKGEKIRTYHQVKFLSEQGHDIGVLSPETSDEDPSNLRELESRHLTLPSSLHKLNPLRLIRGLVTNQALSVANFYCSSLQERLDYMLTEQNIDCVICSSSSMAEYVFRSKICQGKTSIKAPKVIMDFMDLDSDKWRQYAELKSIPMKWIYQRESTLLSAYEHQTYEKFDASFFISQEEVSLFLKGEPNNGRLFSIANGIDTDFFSFSKPREHKLEAPKLVFTGVMDYLPNEDAVIWFVKEVWPTLKKQYANATFYIAGMNPSTKVSKLGEVEGIVVTGKVDDIRSYYHDADVFVAPLRLARGVQNKVLQAFSSGVPVVSTTIGNEGISAKHQEEILIADNSQDFVAAISSLLANDSIRSKLSSQARALVEEKFSWDGQLQTLQGIITQASD